MAVGSKRGPDGSAHLAPKAKVAATASSASAASQTLGRTQASRRSHKHATTELLFSKCQVRCSSKCLRLSPKAATSNLGVDDAVKSLLASGGAKSALYRNKESTSYAPADEPRVCSHDAR